MSSDEKRGSQRPIKQPVVPPGPLADLKALVYELYAEAGSPRLDQIPQWADLAKQAARDDLAAERAWQAVLDDMPERDAIRLIIGGVSLPPSQRGLAAVVKVLANAARRDLQHTAEQALDLWVAARKNPVRVPAGAVRAADADLRRLGVHAAIKVAGVQGHAQPEYVLRDADLGESGVREKIAAAEGPGGFVLLLGGSSVGKTRCAAEAVAAVLPDWHLVQPGGPQDVAALGAAPFPRTVVWLDELQLYLSGERGLSDADILPLLDGPHPVVISRRSGRITTRLTHCRQSAASQTRTGGSGGSWGWPMWSGSARTSPRRSTTGPVPRRSTTCSCKPRSEPADTG
jgi:hypothetical protein